MAGAISTVRAKCGWNARTRATNKRTASNPIAALILAFAFRRTTATYVLIGVLGVFATLKSVFGVCVGYKIFAVLIRLELVPNEICVEPGCSV
jgi:uncharacterized membrane protein